MFLKPIYGKSRISLPDVSTVAAQTAIDKDTLHVIFAHTVTPSHFGFDGEVLRAEFPIENSVAGCGYAPCDPHKDEVPDC